MITKSEASAPEKIVVQKYWSDISFMSGSTGETGLTGGERASLTPENVFQRRKYT